MNKFHSLKVIDIKSLTVDSVQIVFDNSNPEFLSFKAGQYITIRKDINGLDIRRSYSLSSAPGEGVEIGVKRVNKGLMSTFLTRDLKVGDVIDVMLPQGSFLLEIQSKPSHYVAICAGSGITPILSMIKQVVREDTDSFFTIIYGNRSPNSMMFSEDLLALEKDFQSQVFIHYIFSRERIDGYIYGKIDDSMLQDLFDINNNLQSADSYFLCGPGEMIDNTRNFLINSGVDVGQIHFERFTSNITLEKSDSIDLNSKVFVSNVIVSVDGDDFEFQLSSDGETILEAAINEGADVPFSCKGGVCCVCKAKVIEGKAYMDSNSSLSDDEVEQGYILTCQAHPGSEDLVVDFDEI